MVDYSSYTLNVCRSIYEIIGLSGKRYTLDDLKNNEYLKKWDKNVLKNAAGILLDNKLLKVNYAVDDECSIKEEYYPEYIDRVRIAV